jgi:hypothetical protein
MEDQLESIRAAVATGASSESRAAGAVACRVMLAALEGGRAEPVASQPGTPSIAALVGALRGAPPEHLLDFVIARLRAALPPGAEVPPIVPFRVNVVPIPRRG